MRRGLKFAAVGLTAFGLALGSAAWAQQAPAGGPPAGPAGHGRMGGPGCMFQGSRLTEMLSRAHWTLRITPEEDAAWTKMASDVTTALQPLAQECGQRPAQAVALPDRLSRMVEMGQKRDQAFSGVQQAVATMYAQLSPDQKAEADRMFPWHGRHHGPRAGMMGH